MFVFFTGHNVKNNLMRKDEFMDWVHHHCGSVEDEVSNIEKNPNEIWSVKNKVNQSAKNILIDAR